MKLELERNIQALRLQIDKYDVDYSKNLETLTMVSANLMTLLRNVSVWLKCTHRITSHHRIHIPSIDRSCVDRFRSMERPWINSCCPRV